MEDIDRGLHPVVDGQSLDEDEDEDGLTDRLSDWSLAGSFVVCCAIHWIIN